MKYDCLKKIALLVFTQIALTSPLSPAYSTETTPPNNNSANGSFQSNYATSSTSQPKPNAKVVTRNGKEVVTDPRKNQPVMPGTQGLPESQVLLRHDDVAPGLNRQQAMELENQNGKLPPYVEQEMKAKGLLKDAKSATSR